MKLWKCAGCGAAGPDTSRLCDCATDYVVFGCMAERKTGRSWQEMRDKANAAGKYRAAAPETTQALATHLRRMADNAGDQIDADRLSIAANLVDRAHLVAPDAPPDGGPAFPTGLTPGHYSQEGMTLRQYAAIKLRVPDSGTDWLDAMILQAKRDDFAGQALAAWPVTDRGGTMENLAVHCYALADAMNAAGRE